MMPKPQIVDVTLILLAESEKALCVSEDGYTRIWLPKSQIEYEELPSGSVEISLPLWLAQEKKLAGY